jgi:hypothetical protein
MALPEDCYDEYVKTVSNNLPRDPKDWTFKSDQNYRQILEHVSKSQGDEYLKLIQDEFNDFYTVYLKNIIELITENDLIGNPIKSDFNLNNKLIICSPTNWRYIYHSCLILKYIKSLSEKPKRIIEVGAGFGGLIFYLHKMAYMFNINSDLMEYCIFDLPIPGSLQQKYLNFHGINVNVNPKNLTDEISFFISNYAFSELSEKIRNSYSDVINLCQHGFLVWNMISVYQFIEKSLTIEDERPKTGDINKFVRW